MYKPVAICLFLLVCGASVRAQAPSTQPAAGGPSGAYLGAQIGVLGGSAPNAGELFRSYDFVDGSGSQFAGLSVGYDHRARSGLLLGATADLSFGAEPGAYPAITLFGSLRGRAGLERRRWFVYGSAGMAWARFSGSPGGANQAPAAGDRTSWIAGAGIERAFGVRWSANAEFLHAGFGANQFQLGLHYALAGDVWSKAQPVGITPIEMNGWSVHGQTTLVSQYAAPFRAPYRGTNSLDPNSGRETWDATLYIGRELWNGAVVWINPELDQGFGLSNTLGVAGFTSGEAYKVGHANPYVRFPRAFLQQTINLGGDSEKVDPGPNQLPGSRSANRLVATFGKFSVSDLFDTIVVAHDPRGDFMNWSLIDAATFDYAADAWGFTYGAALEWYQGRWVGRAGVFDLSLVPNSVEIDTSSGQYQLVYELERGHVLHGEPGRIAVVGFVSRGRMATYADALAVADRAGTVADVSSVRRYNSRPGVNINVSQQITPVIGTFARVGWADGHVEPYEFTDVDHTLSAGVSFDGSAWHRRGDTIGAALVANGASAIHQAYLAAGGLGILVGDGQLPHPGTESIVESYYRFVVGAWQFTGDYQFVVNPAFNRDRGPVSVFGVRLRTQF